MPSAPVIFTNGMLVLASGSSGKDGGTDLSGYLTQVRLTRSFDQHDTTVMGMTDHRTSLGLGKWSAACTLITGFGSSEVDQYLQGKIGPSSEPLWLYARPVNAARTPSNPEYWGQVNIADYNPMDGNVGDPLKTPLTFVGAGSLLRTASCSS